MTTLTLVGGIPRAGKSSLCDAVEAAGLGFTHVPLDRYVLPVPAGRAFLEWIATPACIAWDLLLAHLDLLEAGVPCYSPRPAWERDWREWDCAGGALTRGAGRRMEPAAAGYLLAGTHAFACPPQRLPTLRVFVRTPLAVVAERLTGLPHDRRAARAVVRARLAPNTAALLRARHQAEAVVDGTARRAEQVRSFLDAHAHAFPGTAPVPPNEASKWAERSVSWSHAGRFPAPGSAGERAAAHEGEPGSATRGH
jgi:hypothetical protein